MTAGQATAADQHAPAIGQWRVSPGGRLVQVLGIAPDEGGRWALEDASDDNEVLFLFAHEFRAWRVIEPRRRSDGWVPRGL